MKCEAFQKSKQTFIFQESLPCFLSLFSMIPSDGYLQKRKKKKICHTINGITILCLAFPAWVPSLGALILGTPHTRTLSYTNNSSICGICVCGCWGEKGVEGVLCVAYFQGWALVGAQAYQSGMNSMKGYLSCMSQ